MTAEIILGLPYSEGEWVQGGKRYGGNLGEPYGGLLRKVRERWGLLGYLPSEVDPMVS